MLKRISTFLAAAVVTLTACGGGDGGPEYATQISEEDMAGAAETSFELIGDVVGGIVSFDGGTSLPELPLAPASAGRTQLDRLLTGIRARGLHRAGRQGARVPASADRPMPSLRARLSSSACEPVVTGVDSLGEWIDSDGDDVPDDYKATFGANCSITEGDWTYTWSGWLQLQDQPGLFGFRIDLSNLKFKEVYNPSGDFDSFEVNGSEIAGYAATRVEHDAHLTYSFIEHSSGALASGLRPSAAVSDLSLEIIWNEGTVFEPYDIITLESVGSGNIAFDIDFRAVLTATGTPDLAYIFHLNATTFLRYDAAICHGIDSGELTGRLNGTDDIYFLITWTGCGTTTYAAHGTTDGGAPARPQFN